MLYLPNIVLFSGCLSPPFGTSKPNLKQKLQTLLKMQLKNLLEAYVAPTFDVVDIAVEQGFALSDGGPGDYTTGDGTLEDDGDNWN